MSDQAITDETVQRRIDALGLTLPEPAAPVAAYVPAVEHRGLLYLSGQLPFEDGELMLGRIGDDRDIVYGQRAARACALMLVSQIGRALRGYNRVERIVRLGVFVNSSADFTEQAKVANGGSDLMREIFGESGRHARSAVGVPVLPLGVAVEIDAIVAVRDG